MTITVPGSPSNRLDLSERYWRLTELRQEGSGQLFQFEQPFEVAALYVRAQRVAEALADCFEDLAGALHVDLVRHLDRAAVVGTLRGARPAKRIAVGILLAPALLAAALVALHGLHLFHHVLGAAAQRFQRAALVADRLVAFALAKRLLGVAHGFAGFAEALVGLHAHAFE